MEARPYKRRCLQRKETVSFAIFFDAVVRADRENQKWKEERKVEVAANGDLARKREAWRAVAAEDD